MKIFLDTASIAEVRKWKKRLFLDGITTNQKIFLAEKGINFRTRVFEICNENVGDVSVELTSHGVGEMIEEARKYATWHKAIVIKVPMTPDGSGLEVIKKLKTYGIKTNATCMMTADQLILAAKAGATYVSLFYNRSKDSGKDADRELQKAKVFLTKDSTPAKKPQIIVGSIRKPSDVSDAFFAGADIVTIPPKILEEILDNKKTIETIKEFDDAWKEFNGR